jgi:signal peptidase I
VTSASPAIGISPLRLAQQSAKPCSSAAGIAEQIRTHGSVCIQVRGMSMFPWIRPGDLVFVRRSSCVAVKAGDVILFQRDGRYFLHRVLRRGKDSGVASGREAQAAPTLETKGDALDGPDQRVSEAQFLGRAVRIHRRRRHIDLHSLGQTLLGRFLSFVSPASFVLYRPLRSAKRIVTRV